MIILVKENNKTENKLSLFKRILNNLFRIDKKKEIVNKESDRYSIYYRDDGINKISEFSEFPAYYKNLIKLEGLWEINPNNHREIVEINSGEKKILRELTKKKEGYFLEKFDNIIWIKENNELEVYDRSTSKYIYIPYLVSSISEDILKSRALLHFVYYYQRTGKPCSIQSIRIVKEIPGYTRQNEEETFIELNPYYKEIDECSGEINETLKITQDLIDFLEGKIELDNKMKEVEYKLKIKENEV